MTPINIITIKEIKSKYMYVRSNAVLLGMKINAVNRSNFRRVADELSYCSFRPIMCVYLSKDMAS